MSFLFKDYSDINERINAMKVQLAKYFGASNWNVYNTRFYSGAASFYAKDKKCFSRNGWTDDYIVYLSW